MTAFKSVNQEYIFHLLLSIDFSKLQKGSTIPTVDSAAIGNLFFALPPLAEQKRIVDYIMALFDHFDKISSCLS